MPLALTQTRPRLSYQAARRGLALAVGVAAAKHHYTSSLSCAAVLPLPAEATRQRQEPAAEKDSGKEAEGEAQSWLQAARVWLSSCAQYLRAWYRMAYCTTVVSSVAWAAPGILFFQDKEALYRYIIACIEHLGPTFIKLAQWASSRPDLFDEELIVHLVKLQDSTNTYPLSVAHSTLRHEFGDNWQELLTLDPVPIGAGCIAQVNRCIHYDTNTI
jgi:hypothetical protein